MCATPFAVREICTVLAGGAAAVVDAPPETVEHATIFANVARQSAPSATRPGDWKFTSTPEASSSIGRLAATRDSRAVHNHSPDSLRGRRTQTIADGVDRRLRL